MMWKPVLWQKNLALARCKGLLLLGLCAHACAQNRQDTHDRRFVREAVAALQQIVEIDGLGVGKEARKRARLLEFLAARFDARGRFPDSKMPVVTGFRKAQQDRDIEQMDRLSVELAATILELMRKYGY